MQLNKVTEKLIELKNRYEMKLNSSAVCSGSVLLQAGFLYFSQNRGFHLWELDLAKKELRLQYLIHEDLRGRLHYQTEVFPSVLIAKIFGFGTFDYFEVQETDKEVPKVKF